MSEGYFINTKALKSIADDIQDVIEANECTESYYKYSNATIREFKKAITQLNIAYVYVKNIEYLVEGVCSERTFQKI